MLRYPTVRDETVLSLTPVLKRSLQDPSYLSDPECPYSDLVKDFFRQFQVTKTVDLFEDKDELVVIDQQIHAIINDLEAVAAQLGSADHSEKLTYFKTKSSLLEKLIGMRERVLNLREVNEFRSVILAFLDEVCSKDQITDLMKRLDGVLGSNTDNDQ